MSDHVDHMTPDEFRTAAHAAVEWIVGYMKSVERYPVLSQVKPGEIRASLPVDAPEHGEPFDHLLRDLDDIVMPGITHWQSPNFFGYFPANVSGPSILGDLISSALGVQGMLWATSPACTEVETHVLDWLVDLLGLPSKFKSTAAGGGVIQDTASSASLCALLAARERTTDFTTNVHGVDRPLIAYASNQAHSSIEKGMMIAGLGRENLRLIDVDHQFAMKPDALAAALSADRAAGRVPFFVGATVGTTASNGIDPIPAIAEICAEYGTWLHVDAAMSGTAALCPEYRWIHAGLEAADSYCFNPHKWMFTNFDCDCFYVADRSVLIRTLSILPEYLKNAATLSGEVFDYRDWHVPLGRRFRSLKLWFVLRSYGHAGLQRYVREHIAMAQWFAEQVRSDARFELSMDPPLTLVCFRHVDGDAVTQQLMESLNATGRIFLTHAKLNDQYVIRMSIGGTNTRTEHVHRAWELISDAAP